MSGTGIPGIHRHFASCLAGSGLASNRLLTGREPIDVPMCAC